MAKLLTRRPILSDKIAASLERLVELAPDLSNGAPEILAALEYCAGLCAYRKGTQAEREAIRQRTKRLRVATPPALISYNGQEKPLKTICRELKLPYSVVYERMRKGESFESAIQPGDRRAVAQTSIPEIG